MKDEFEELEQIPWASLASTPGDARTRNAALAVVGVAVAIIAAFWFTSRQPSPTVTLPTETLPAETLPAETLPADSAPPPSVAPVAPVASTVAEPVYSEADLMLIDVDDEEMLAIAHAEWLVRDYLTVDGDPVVSTRIAELMPDAPERTDPSYVEWVKALSVDSSEPGRYRVEVLFRVLVGGDEGFVRTPAGALAVDLAVDVDGSARLLAEPEEIPAPTMSGLG